jgi:hypothetical protein
MTARQDDNSDVNELIGEWLDEGVAKDNEMKTLDAAHRRQAADLLLVHSLLNTMARENEIGREVRVKRAMNAINATKPQLVLSLVRYGIAAMLAVAALFLLTKMPASSAMAAVDQMIAAIDKAGDRTYRITVLDGRRGPQPQGQPGERAGLDGATLYLRGSDKFVLVRKTPSGKDLINGSDGQIRWLVRPEKPVLVSTDPQAFRIPMPQEMAEILPLDLKSTLIHIRDHYTVKYVSEPPADQAQHGSLKYMDAAKASRDFRGPKNIELWADAESGLLVRMEFGDIHLQGDPAPKRLIIELVGRDQLPDDWFSHQAHHDADVPVEEL